MMCRTCKTRMPLALYALNGGVCTACQKGGLSMSQIKSICKQCGLAEKLDDSYINCEHAKTDRCKLKGW